MDKYHCELCNFRSKLKTDYKRHLSSKKHKEAIKTRNNLGTKWNKMEQNEVIEEQNGTILDNKTNKKNKNILCKYCKKGFTSEKSMKRHITYTCKKNHDEDLRELVRLLNEKNESLQNQIDKLSQKLQMQNVNSGMMNSHHNMHSNNKYDIKILNYNNTDYEHLTEKDYLNCLKDNNHCVKRLIEKVHFDKEKKENHNIYISNIKNNYVMVYSDGQWTLVDRTKQITDLYDKNEYELETWYDNYKEKYPHIVKSFTRYLKNKEEDDDLLNDIKDQVILMLYNKRNVVL